MIFIILPTGRLLPSSHLAVDDFGEVLTVSPEAQKRAWYFLGVWRVFAEYR